MIQSFGEEILAVVEKSRKWITMAKLFWNNQGQIGCSKHMPFQGSDTYVNEQWMAIDPVTVTRSKLKCEVCK